MQELKSTARCLVLVALSGSASAQAWIDAPRVLVGTDSDFRAVADVDGDGDEDLLAVVRSAEGLFQGFYVLYCTGPDAYTAGPTRAANSGLNAFLLGDLTGDGLPELVFDSGGTQRRISFCRNQGGTLAKPVLIPVQAGVTSMDLGDRDGDGVLDLAVLEYSGMGVPDLIRWWSWNGTTLVPGASSHTPGSGASWVRALDLSGDGRADIVAGGHSSPVLRVAETQADGEPGPFSAQSPVGDPYSEFEAWGGDLEGDGDAELVALWFEDGTGRHLGVIDSLGGGALACDVEQELAILSGDGWVRGHLADWDLDGDLDLVTSAWNLQVLENAGNGGFRACDSVKTPSHSLGAGAADLNDDGFPDFAAGRVVLHGDGSVRKPQSQIRGGLFRTLDLDGDGDLDLANTERDLWLNDGTGAMLARDLVVAPPPADSFFVECTALGDLDGDGRPDYLFWRRKMDVNGAYPVQDTRLLRGTFTGDFEDAGPAAAPFAAVGLSSTFDVPPSDVDGDLDLDVLGPDGWWENDGSGFFTGLHAAWSGLPRAAADVDGDLDLDVVTYSSSGPTTSYHLQRNQGGDTFAAELLVTEAVAGDLMYRPRLADSDGDGDPELAIGTTANGPRVLFFDNAGGSFGSPLELPGLTTALWVLTFSDVDGDGSLDVIGAVGGLAGTWLVWRRAGAGFDPPRAYYGSAGILSGDVDQDGDTDVIGARVVRNQLFHGRADGLARQYGVGTRGSGNATPALGALGPLRPGSASAALRIANGRGGSLATVRAGTGPAHAAREPLRGPSLLVRGPFLSTTLLLGGTPGAPGGGQGELSLTPLTISLAGQELWMQAMILDPGARGGISTTNGLELVLGKN